MAQGFLDFGKSAVDLFGTGGASIADLIESARTGKVTTKNSDDFRKWLYDTNDVKDAAAKGLGTALNGVQTVSDYIPGIGAVTRNPLFNAGQGALGGLADEFKMYGKDYDLGRAGQRAAVGAGGALASTGLADALKGSGNALLKSGTAQGLARGAVGGAIGAGGYTAIDGGSLGDVANSALQGAGMGAALGGTMGALQDFKPAKTYDVALTDEEKAARIATIDDQLSKLDTSTPEGGARYNELIKARAVYDAPADKIQTLYHQTSADSFADFSPERRSAGVMDQGTPSGIFLKETDADIGLPGKNQLMFDVKMENPYEVDSREALANYARSRSKAYADLYDQAVALDEKAANVYDDFTNELQDKYKRYYYEADEAKKAALKKDVDYLLKNIQKLSDEKAAEYKSQGADVARRAQDELNRVLTQDGYDSVILANDKGSFGRNIKSYIALSPYDQMAEVNAPKALENTLADADMAVNSPRYLTDENGNPRTFYHGSPNANITEFDINQAGKNTMSGEHALFFTDDLGTADNFAHEQIPTESMFFVEKGKRGKVYPVNLEMNNPLDLDNLTDAQIEELWPYASQMGSWQGKDHFVKQLTDWRDKYHNAQQTKGYLDLDKLRDSQYDGIIARMYPNQDNQAREYAVFDNSKIKMLEDLQAVNDANIMASRVLPDDLDLGRALAGQDLSVNNAKIAPGQLGLFDDIPTQTPKTGTRQTSLFDQPQEELDYYGEDIESPVTTLANPYAPVDGQVTQAMRDRASEIIDNLALKRQIPDNELFNRIDQSTLPKGQQKIGEFLDQAYAKGLTHGDITDMMRETVSTEFDKRLGKTPNKDELISFIFGNADETAKKEMMDKAIGLYVAPETMSEGTLNSMARNKISSEIYGDNLSALVAGDRTLRGGYTGALDSVLSERLGIAPGNTYKKTGAYDTGGSYGRYQEYRNNPNKNNIMVRTALDNEDAVNTMAHERLHSFQTEAKKLYDQDRYSPEVKDAYDELAKDLKSAKAYRTGDEIKKRYGRDVAYWRHHDEQEARMLQQYLDGKGYTGSRHHNENQYLGLEFDDAKITPAFDKFFDKLRDLSKRGVALPALTALFGGGALMANQQKDKEEVK